LCLASGGCLTSFSNASDSFCLYCLSGSFPNDLYCRTRIPLNRKLCKNDALSRNQVPTMTTRRLAGFFLLFLIASSSLCQAWQKKERDSTPVRQDPASEDRLSGLRLPEGNGRLGAERIGGTARLGPLPAIARSSSCGFNPAVFDEPIPCDYLTRDGPDKRPALVDYTILTIVDGHTGQYLWTDYKRWGYILVSEASRSLMHEFRLAVAAQVKSRNFSDILSCSNSPVYAAFANLPRQRL
jgi:hypothetical protein